MKKRYYLAALFAISLAIQPALVKADTARKTDGMENMQQQKNAYQKVLLTDSNGDPIIGATIW